MSFNYKSYTRYDKAPSFADLINEICERSDLKGSITTGYSYGEVKQAKKSPLPIKKVHFNDPYTIVIWNDGTKTIVKTQNNEVYDAEKGLAMCISKKALGNKSNYYNTFKKYSDGLVMTCGVAKDFYDKADDTRDKAYQAYLRLVNCLNNKKATKDVLWASIEEAVGYLGEVLDI